MVIVKSKYIVLQIILNNYVKDRLLLDKKWSFFHLVVVANALLAVAQCFALFCLKTIEINN